MQVHGRDSVLDKIHSLAEMDELPWQRSSGCL